MADPFDALGSDTPDSSGGGGVSPDFWHNLMTFGLATMQAGGQPGATKLGALGTGGLAAVDESRRNALSRTNNQLGQQNVISARTNNAMQLYNLNLTRQMMGMPPISMPGVPDLMGQQGGQQYGQSDPASPQQGVTQGGTPPENSSGQTWSQNAGMSAPPPQTRAERVGGMTVPKGMDPSDFKQSMIASRLNMPEISKLYQEPYMASFKPIEARQGGIAAIPGLGVVAQGRLEGMSPGGAKYLTPPSITMNGQSLLEGGAQPGMAAAPQPQQGAIPPVNATTLNAGGNPSPGIQIPFPAPPETNQPPREAAFMPNQQMQQQQSEQITPPAAAPKDESPKQYAGVPSGSTLTDIGKGAETQIEDAMKFHADGEHGELKGYQAASQAQQNLTLLRNYLDTANKAGGDTFLKSGAGAQVRTEAAKAANAAWGVVGGDGSPFNPEQIASNEGAMKVTNLLGMQMISQMFGAQREAGNIIMTGIKSQPGITTSPLGSKILANGLQELSNNTMDRYTFKDWWARPDGPHPGDLRGADIAFNRTFPPQAYSMRAISLEQPINVNTPGARASLLPGTKYMAPDGSMRMVPPFSPQQLQQKYGAAEQTPYTPEMQQIPRQ